MSSGNLWVARREPRPLSSDDVLGEVVIDYVALRPGADVTVDELHARCADRVATPFVGGAAPASPIVGVN